MTTTQRSIQHEGRVATPMLHPLGHNRALLQIAGYVVVEDAVAGTLRTVTMRKIDPDTGAHHVVTMREWQHVGERS